MQQTHTGWYGAGACVCTVGCRCWGCCNDGMPGGATCGGRGGDGGSAGARLAAFRGLYGTRGRNAGRTTAAAGGFWKPAECAVRQLTVPLGSDCAELINTRSPSPMGG